MARPSPDHHPARNPLLHQPSWPGILGALTEERPVTAADTAWAMGEIMSDNATSAQIAALAVALKMKRPTADELVGLADGMLAHARLVDGVSDAVDVVGTGGDRSGSVNISTMTAIVVAATGVPVVKHGNRASSSKSGGADVLEALGVRLQLGPEAVARCVRELGIGFCFAPMFHPGFRFAGPTRKEIAVPTVFNVLGPLTNPARPRAGLIGCAFADLQPVMAEVLARRGTTALVVRGDDGLDELTTTGPSRVFLVSGGTVEDTAVDPARLGFARVEPAALSGGDAVANAAVARDLLAGSAGPVRDAVLLNAAGAIVAFDGPPPA
ncbi:MAG: anthranilate phosphoribosyltransferase, partial [Mycobacteriaceae bacterium]|nr:anthranilate phosphoribosyltransferase [Mycobacteriaceae bacterium]